MTLAIYSREYCSLCHAMVAALQALQAHHHFTLEIVDIDEDDALEARFGEKVPVLLGQDGREICHYHLDQAALLAYLAGFAK